MRVLPLVNRQTSKGSNLLILSPVFPRLSFTGMSQNATIFSRRWMRQNKIEITSVHWEPAHCHSERSEESLAPHVLRDSSSSCRWRDSSEWHTKARFQDGRWLEERHSFRAYLLEKPRPLLGELHFSDVSWDIYVSLKNLVQLAELAPILVVEYIKFQQVNWYGYHSGAKCLKAVSLSRHDRSWDRVDIAG